MTVEPDASDHHVVLVGMSVREAAADRQMAALAEAAGGTVAHLQLGNPTLARQLDRLAGAGATTVSLVGVSLGSLAPAASWLRRVAAYWWGTSPEPRPRIEISTMLVSREDQLGEALASCRPVTGREPGLRSAAWEEVPRHRHQLLVCRGPRCTALGSDRSAEAFVLALIDHELEDDDVLLVHTGCQFPCNQAPVVSVQPDDVWYGGVDPDAAGLIVAEHLVGDRPVEGLRLPRSRRD